MEFDVLGASYCQDAYSETCRLCHTSSDTLAELSCRCRALPLMVVGGLNAMEADVLGASHYQDGYLETCTLYGGVDQAGPRGHLAQALGLTTGMPSCETVACSTCCSAHAAGAAEPVQDCNPPQQLWWHIKPCTEAVSFRAGTSSAFCRHREAMLAAIMHMCSS